jgi:integrase
MQWQTLRFTGCFRTGGFVMQKKPFFRTFDQCWYAYAQSGTKRKQVKLKDRDGEPIRGQEGEGDAFLAFCRLMAADPAHVPDATRLNVRKVCDLFLDHSQRHNDAGTYEWYRSYLQSFCDEYGRLNALKVKPIHVSRWLDAHAAWKSSRRCAVVSIKRAYNWAESEGILDENPLKHVKRPPNKRRERIPTNDERAAILGAIKDEGFRQFLYAMQETGARPGEVRKVAAAHFSEEHGAWILPEHKTKKRTGKPRVIYLTPAMIELTKKLIAQWPEGPLFRGPKRKGSRPFTRNAIRCRFFRLRRKLPHLKGIVSYSYRHGFITDALERGVPVASVAELVGHTDLKMVSEFYGHLSEKRQHLQDAVKRATGCA